MISVRQLLMLSRTEIPGATVSALTDRDADKDNPNHGPRPSVRRVPN